MFRESGYRLPATCDRIVVDIRDSCVEALLDHSDAPNDVWAFGIVRRRFSLDRCLAYLDGFGRLRRLRVHLEAPTTWGLMDSATSRSAMMTSSEPLIWWRVSGWRSSTAGAPRLAGKTTEPLRLRAGRTGHRCESRESALPSRRDSPRGGRGCRHGSDTGRAHISV